MNVFSIASYNILANAYMRPQWYAHCCAEALAASPRVRRLTKKLVAFNADIFCLQEVEPEVFRSLEAALTPQGFVGLYAQKRRNKPDGCATFYKNKRFMLKAQAVHYFEDGGSGGEHSGHLALQVDLASDEKWVRVINTHLKWDNHNRSNHLGHQQIGEIMAKQSAIEARTHSCIICGDFNAPPNHFVLDALTQHHFIDAYAHQPQATCNPNQSAKRIDYVFHTPDMQAFPVAIADIADNTPLPSLTEPSDHLLIAVQFKLGQCR